MQNGPAKLHRESQQTTRPNTDVNSYTPQRRPSLFASPSATSLSVFSCMHTSTDPPFRTLASTRATPSLTTSECLCFPGAGTAVCANQFVRRSADTTLQVRCRCRVSTAACWCAWLEWYRGLHRTRVVCASLRAWWSCVGPARGLLRTDSSPSMPVRCAASAIAIPSPNQETMPHRKPSLY